MAGTGYWGCQGSAYCSSCGYRHNGNTTGRRGIDVPHRHGKAWSSQRAQLQRAPLTKEMSFGDRLLQSCVASGRAG